MTAAIAALQGLTIFERGWLSSNNVLVHGNGAGASLIDTSHSLHAAQTVALVRHALQQSAPRESLVRIVNTHLHSDHCGGNAAIQQHWACPISVPVGQFEAARHWREEDLRSEEHTSELQSPC